MSDQTQLSVAENLGNIKAKINAAAHAFREKTGIVNPVTLVAVSKRQPDDRIDAALVARPARVWRKPRSRGPKPMGATPRSTCRFDIAS